MSRHLSDVELVDYTDGALPEARATHLESCGDCRARAESFRSLTAAVLQSGARDVPEPSPLFWEHFSQHVRDGLHERQPLSASGWLLARFPAWGVAALVAIVAGIVLSQYSRPATVLAPAPAIVMGEPSAVASDDRALDLDDDADWALVRVVADDLEWDDAAEAGIQARPGSVERVALEMSAVEREELARLIETEMKRTGA